MDFVSIERLQQTIVQVLQEYRDFLGADPESEIMLVFDEDRHHYILLEAGWHGNQRLYGNLLHLDIRDNKIWIQQDGTEVGIANELVTLGISPKQIVLAFKALARREITDFAVC